MRPWLSSLGLFQNLNMHTLLCFSRTDKRVCFAQTLKNLALENSKGSKGRPGGLENSYGDSHWLLYLSLVILAFPLTLPRTPGTPPTSLSYNQFR